jgi:hypothetical protein
VSAKYLLTGNTTVAIYSVSRVTPGNHPPFNSPATPFEFPIICDFPRCAGIVDISGLSVSQIGVAMFGVLFCCLLIAHRSDCRTTHLDDRENPVKILNPLFDGLANESHHRSIFTVKTGFWAMFQPLDTFQENMDRVDNLNKGQAGAIASRTPATKLPARHSISRVTGLPMGGCTRRARPDQSHSGKMIM